MAERKSSLLAKSVSKHAGRAKEKFLQNLGKVDRTADDIFDEHLENFNRQQLAAGRLQKEFNNYIRCIRAVHGASKSLYDCLKEVYEVGWVGKDVLHSQTQDIEMLWQDLSHKLADQVLLPLNTYYSQFPEMRKKIDKRSRKLVDYDGQRHNMQSLEGGGGKKRDEAKVQKAKEQLQMAKQTYDTLNSELHDDLPALYHSRILFFVNNLQTLFSAEQVFHSETAKIFAELEAIIDKLAMDTQKQSYSPRKISSPMSNSIHAGSPGSPSSAAEEIQSDPESSKEPETPSGADLTNSNLHVTTNGTAEETTTPALVENGSTDPSASESSPLYENQVADTPTAVNGNSAPSPKLTPNATPTTTESNNNKRVEELYDIPVGANTDNLPPGVLYKVKATYRYTREDLDELSFEVGDIIRVVAYDDPAEQEDGWLMGIKEGTDEKGMFPANFTRPL